jgi:hypothetical protein
MAPGITRTQRVLIRGSLRCLVFFGGLVLVLSIAEWPAGNSLNWTASVVERPTLTTSGDARVYQTAVQVDLLDPSNSLWVSTRIPTVVVCVAMMLTGILLVRLFHETAAGRPFFDGSVRRLRAVSAVVAVAAIVEPITRAWADNRVLDAVTTHPALEPTGPHWRTMATWLVVALVMLVVTEAFRIGTRLRDDADGLV